MKIKYRDFQFSLSEDEKRRETKEIETKENIGRRYSKEWESGEIS